MYLSSPVAKRQQEKAAMLPINPPPIQQPPERSVIPQNTNLRLDEAWAILKPGFDTVFSFASAHDTEGNLNMKLYAIYYTTVYNFCVSVTRDSHDYDSAVKLAHASNGPPAQLSRKIGSFVREHLIWTFRPEMASHHGDALLRFYTEKWREFRFSARVAHGICSYLNEHFLRRRAEQVDGVTEDIFPIYGICLREWRDAAFVPVEVPLWHAVAAAIKDDRNGNTASSQMIRTVVDCLVELGLTLDTEVPASAGGNPNGPQGLALYRKYLEEPFLQDTRLYYVNERLKSFTDNSMAKYAEKSEARIKEEEDRCLKYLHGTTYATLQKTVEDVFIIQQLTLLRQELIKHLNNEQVEEVKAMFPLMSRVPLCLDDLSTHVRRKGQDALAKNPTAMADDPNMFLTAILAIYDRFLPLVIHFRGDQKFNEAFDKGFYAFVNDNPVTALSNSSKKSAELFARYCNILLKKGAKNLSEADLEGTLVRVMIVFKYIEDKDVFQRHYQKCLCRRLISEQSASDDAEASMIWKLKVVAGWEYVTKLQRMFQDIALSTEMNHKFREADTGKLHDWEFEFGVQVLASGSWPLIEDIRLVLPQEMERPLRFFRDFYIKQFSGRKLNWVFPNSRCEISSSCFKMKHVITVSATQAGILLAYNDSQVRTIGELRTMLGFTERSPAVDSHFRQSLLLILTSKVLLVGKEDEKLQESDLGDEETPVKLNLAFRDKRLRFKLNLPIRAEQKQEEDVTSRGIDEDRQATIQAAIVRVMKMRKKLKHQMLIGEVMEILAARFKPNVPVIKKNIETLIEKEYLRRSEEERDLYIYVA